MTKLTSKQEAFAVYWASGLNQTEAYVKAYCTDGMKKKTSTNRAHELAHNPKVLARYKELIQDRVDSMKWSIDEATEVLKKVVTNSLETEKYMFVIAAVKELNSLYSLYKTIEGDDGDDKDIKITVVDGRGE